MRLFEKRNKHEWTSGEPTDKHGHELDIGVFAILGLLVLLISAECVFVWVAVKYWLSGT